MSTVPLYTIGNFTIDDIVIWPTGQTWMGQPGGNVLFSAIGASIWLDHVGILARLGNDYPAERLHQIEARGLCMGLVPVDAPTLHDWALYEANGGRQFINHLNSGQNVDASLIPEEIPIKHSRASAYHIAPFPTDRQAPLVDHLARPGRIISLDPHELWIKGYEDKIDRMLEQVDFFLPSELEASHLYGANDPERAAVAFARKGPRAVVIKLGLRGSLVYERERNLLTHVPAYPAKVIDTTGAGDSYCGGFLAGYLVTQDAVMAAIYGTVSASYVVEAIGSLSTPQPAHSEARKRLQYVAGQIKIDLDSNEGE